jgi:hypothetical protein
LEVAGSRTETAVCMLGDANRRHIAGRLMPTRIDATLVP